MKSNRRTVSIDSKVYDKFKKFCDLYNFKVAKQVEKILLEYVVNLEKGNENIN